MSGPADESSFLGRIGPAMSMWGGLIVLAATFLNEILMGVAGGAPLWWAIPYFPLRTVALPLASIFQIFLSVRALWRDSVPLRRVAAFAGIAMSIATVWFNWFSRDMLFFAFPKR